VKGTYVVIYICVAYSTNVLDVRGDARRPAKQYECLVDSMGG
jgi:hypothetical protein